MCTRLRGLALQLLRRRGAKHRAGPEQGASGTARTVRTRTGFARSCSLQEASWNASRLRRGDRSNRGQPFSTRCGGVAKGRLLRFYHRRQGEGVPSPTVRSRAAAAVRAWSNASQSPTPGAAAEGEKDSPAWLSYTSRPPEEQTVMPAPPASPPQVIRTILSAVGVRCSDDLKKCSCEQASQDSIGQRIPSLRPASGALGQPQPPPSAST